MTESAGNGSYVKARPRLLDLFCGAGGAAMGYQRAGFDVVGVDIAPQPHYPFEFHQDDALALLADPYSPIGDFDAIHASPPCQAYTRMRGQSNEHPDLYVLVRERLAPLGVPWIVENVSEAPYRSGFILCGSMFDLQVRRHRNFETSLLMLRPACRHVEQGRPYTITGHGWNKAYEGRHSKQAPKDQWPALLGTPWMTPQETTQAIPPAYTEWIGARLLEALGAAA